MFDNGEEIEVGPGDVVYTADGATHSIRDAGNGDLVMLAAVIFENKKNILNLLDVSNDNINLF